MELTDREKTILDYVRQNPHCSKADIIRFMSDSEKSSRITTLNILRKLEEETLLIAKREKTNSQIYRISLNNSNLLALLIAELVEVEQNFSKLIDKICLLQTSDQMKYPSTMDERGNGEIFVPVLAFRAFDILLDVIIIYNYRLIILWSHYFADQVTQESASKLVSSSMNKIRKEMFDKFEPYYKWFAGFDETKKNKKNGLVAWLDDLYLSASFPKRLVTFDEDPKINGAEAEMRPLLEFIRKIDSKNPLYEGTFDHYIEEKSTGK